MKGQQEEIDILKMVKEGLRAPAGGEHNYWSIGLYICFNCAST